MNVQTGFVHRFNLNNNDFEQLQFSKNIFRPPFYTTTMFFVENITEPKDMHVQLCKIQFY